MNFYKNKIYFAFLIALFFVDINALHSARPYQSRYRQSALKTRHAEVNAVIRSLQRLPESNQVIEEALRQGSITVEVSTGRMPFNAMWENAPRRIVVDKRAARNQGSLLCHVLFELMNAASEEKYQELCEMAIDGLIDCDTYVEAVERIEYENMLRADAIVEKGVFLGVFPSAERWGMIDDFATHYKIQQLAGHSTSIVQEYREMTGRRSISPYRGTVRNLQRMSPREKMSQIERLHFQSVQRR